MTLVRQTQDGVNGNSSSGIPVEYECTSGVLPYVYRTVSGMDEDANGVIDQNPGTAFSEIPSFQLSGQRVFFHKFFVYPVWDSEIDYSTFPTGSNGANISLFLLWNLFNARDPQASLPSNEFPLQSNTAFNLFRNDNIGGAGVGILSVPSYWKPILINNLNLNSLIAATGGIGAAEGAQGFKFLPAGEYKAIVIGAATDAAFNSKNVTLMLSHSE